MSYTRRYSETVYQTRQYSYPASQSGGTGSITVEVPIDINIHVDTNPFDDSVRQCGNNINLLTGAVVATESAEIASKAANSKRVASTIVGGFFSYIRSEISAQISELTQNVEAQLMHLKELAQSCIAKKTQMESDYRRISSRYGKIFDDLNNELSNRVYELDRPAFEFKKEIGGQQTRSTNDDLVNTISIFGSESGELQSNLCSSVAKNRALYTLVKIKEFILQQNNLEKTIKQSMLNDNKSNTIFIPVCFVETNDENNQNAVNIYCSGFFPTLKENYLRNKISDGFTKNISNWNKLGQNEHKNIDLYFSTELNNSTEGDSHSVRVRETIKKIAHLNQINAIHYQ